jgi:hypothetical protein
MASEMVERVARAMCWKIEAACEGECAKAQRCVRKLEPRFIEAACAAIQELREPTEVMSLAGQDTWWANLSGTDDKQVRACWRAMIDKVLSK